MKRQMWQVGTALVLVTGFATSASAQRPGVGWESKVKKAPWATKTPVQSYAKVCVGAGIEVVGAKVCKTTDGKVTGSFKVGPVSVGSGGVGVGTTFATPGGGVSVSGTYNPADNSVTACTGPAVGLQADNLGVSVSSEFCTKVTPSPITFQSPKPVDIKPISSSSDSNGGSVSPGMCTPTQSTPSSGSATEAPYTPISGTPMQSTSVGFNENASKNGPQIQTQPLQSVPERIPGSQSQSAAIRF